MITHRPKISLLMGILSKPLRQIYTSAFARPPISDLACDASLAPAAAALDSSPTTWLKHHLFTLGYETVRFYAYQTLSPLTIQKGGGFVKTVVSDLSSFVKREWAGESDLFERVCENLPFFTVTNIPDSRRFFMSLGGMLLSGKETKVRLLTEELLRLYMERMKCSVLFDASITGDQKQILKVASSYFRTCKINYRMLYDMKTGPRCISVGERQLTIDLPPLPQISSKQLLARALLHKELCSALTSPGHPVHAEISKSNHSLEYCAKRVIRHDLSFLDGLGDLLIASESCQFLYDFRLSHPYANDPSFGRKTFTMLKNILGTNSLLSRLATSYNLHLALEDPHVSHLLRESYIPQTFSAKHGPDSERSIYEEEFLADYFEQYIGALFLDSPEEAKRWLNVLFERVVSSINDEYKVHFRRRREFRYDYRAWSVDVIGRTI